MSAGRAFHLLKNVLAFWRRRDVKRFVMPRHHEPGRYIPDGSFKKEKRPGDALASRDGN